MNISTEVIICTYNGSSFIIEQLKSILEQSHKVSKISIYDDQSTDATVALINTYISGFFKNSRTLISIQTNEVNLGYAVNFCNGILKATEDVLFLCDQDDIWEVDKVKIILNTFSNNSVDLVFSDGILINSIGDPISKYTVLESYGLSKKNILFFAKNNFSFLAKRNCINGAALAITRTAAHHALPLPCNMPHDYWLGIWCSLNNRVIAIPQPLYKYRQHKNNVIGIDSQGYFRKLRNIWRYCDSPREREKNIWAAITERIAHFADKEQLNYAHDKLNWLTNVISTKYTWKRIFYIITSIMNGDYRKFSPDGSALRDVFSVIKSKVFFTRFI